MLSIKGEGALAWKWVFWVILAYMIWLHSWKLNESFLALHSNYSTFSLYCETLVCSLLTIKRAWSRDHPTSSVTAILSLPGQRCGTVCPNSFGNRTSPSNNSNDRWKRLCLVSRAAAPCVWTLRALTRNLLTYLLTKIACAIYRATLD